MENKFIFKENKIMKIKLEKQQNYIYILGWTSKSGDRYDNQRYTLSGLPNKLKNIEDEQATDVTIDVIIE